MGAPRTSPSNLKKPASLTSKSTIQFRSSIDYRLATPRGLGPSSSLSNHDIAIVISPSNSTIDEFGYRWTLLAILISQSSFPGFRHISVCAFSNFSPRNSRTLCLSIRHQVVVPLTDTISPATGSHKRNNAEIRRPSAQCFLLESRDAYSTVCYAPYAG